MVVTAIFVILSAIVLASNSRFGSAIILQNLAHDIALSIREAQIYGIAVRRYDPSAGPGTFGQGYGIHFAPGTSFELFADVNGNGKWESTETVKTTTIAGGFAITNVCSPEDTCGLTSVDILFKRPEPDACISANGAVTLSDGSCISALQRATIDITSPRSEAATIVIEASGQISVQ